jgi:hypothetical protein
MSGRTRKIGKGKGPRKNKPARARGLILGDRRTKLLDTVAKLVAETEKKRVELLVCEQQIVSNEAAETKAKAKVTKAAAKVAAMAAKTEAAAAWDLSRGGDSTDKAKYDGGVVCVGTLSSEIKCEYCGNMYTGESSCKNLKVCPDAACVQEYADDAFEV